MALRNRLTGAFSGPFWLTLLCAALAPTTIGFQDLSFFLARRPGVSESWGRHLLVSPFGAVHAATFFFSHTSGEAIPEPIAVQPVNFDPRSLNVKTWFVDQPPLTRAPMEIEYPIANRALKRNRLSLPPRFTQPDSAPAVESEGARASAVNHDDRRNDKPPAIPAAGESDPADAPPTSFVAHAFVDEDPMERNTEVYFGDAAMGAPAGLEQWAPGAGPVETSPAIGSAVKLTALGGAGANGGGSKTIADKADTDRVQSPADRLGLRGKPRARAEKCLADAIYFEARGESLRGQMAVAQVVMNRVFSGYYPNDVCGVVYQNARHHLACQFTFACDGIPDVVNEPDMWEQAKHIAKDMLDGKIWLAEVGYATHYHAYWVHPSWVAEMKKMYRLGVHTFYRPRAWGDGEDVPMWGGQARNSPASSGNGGKPEAAGNGADAAAKGPEAESTRRSPVVNDQTSAQM